MPNKMLMLLILGGACLVQPRYLCASSDGEDENFPPLKSQAAHFERWASSGGSSEDYSPRKAGGTTPRGQSAWGKLREAHKRRTDLQAAGNAFRSLAALQMAVDSTKVSPRDVAEDTAAAKKARREKKKAARLNAGGGSGKEGKRRSINPAALGEFQRKVRTTLGQMSGGLRASN